MNVADRVTVAGRGGIVTRVFPSGWLRVAIDGDKGLPQDYPATSCRKSQHGGDLPATLDGWCWCGDRLSRHAAPCTPQDGQNFVTTATPEESGARPAEPALLASVPSDSLVLEAEAPACCAVCGAILVARSGAGRPREFCSTRCRVAAHRAKV